ncbi:hypothetical protein EV401DRAFT_1559905 [Pisolithus croceorrhizus]|nr:hypothetical protein EV401DRAFT_1559905 [Pisolithus croceorrhizus]
MAPARSNRRTHQEQPVQLRNTPSDTNAANKTDLFLEPMMGTPLTVYIEKDVEEKESLVELIAKHGGAVSPGYSGTPYILVDPHKESGQNLYRQYAGKKGKVVLHYRWIHECIRVGALQTFQNNWAGCKVTGTEKLNLSTSPPSQDGPACSTQSTQVPPMQSIPPHPQTVPSIVSPDPLVHPPQQGSHLQLLLLSPGKPQMLSHRSILTSHHNLPGCFLGQRIRIEMARGCLVLISRLRYLNGSPHQGSSHTTLLNISNPTNNKPTCQKLAHPLLAHLALTRKPPLRKSLVVGRGSDLRQRQQPRHRH